MTKNVRIPPGGMGNGLERAYSENFFIVSGYNIIKIISILLFLIHNETKALQNAKIKDYSKKRETTGGIRMVEKPLSNITFFYFCYAF